MIFPIKRKITATKVAMIGRRSMQNMSKAHVLRLKQAS